MNAKNKSVWIVTVMVIGLALVISACGAAATEAPQVHEAVSEVEAEEAAPGSSGGGGGDAVGAVEPAAEEPAAEEGYAAPPAEAADADRAAAPLPTAVAAEAEVPAAGEELNPVAPSGADVVAGGGADVEYVTTLQAGEVDDNGDFGEYLQYRLDFHDFLGYPVHDVEIRERHVINVRTRSGLPVLAAQVSIYDPDRQNVIRAIRTTATGVAYFFPLASSATAAESSYYVVVEKGGESTDFMLDRGDGSGGTWDVTLNVPQSRPPVNLDVLFLIDATGSMADEIQQLQDNIVSISAQVAALPSQPNVRFGMVAYRDREDEFITRTFDFTPDVGRFQADLRDLRAEGGGDTPESLNEALHVAVWNPSWRVDDTVSLMFLVADAAPHLDYVNDYDYAVEMQEAAARGIKIHPIASSGLDDQGEYIFRQIAQFTGGHFLFLTYEETPQPSGEPGTEHHVQPGYSVEDLDGLVLRLIRDELALLVGE